MGCLSAADSSPLEVKVSIDNDVDHDTVPPANKGLLAIAGVLLAIPVVALLWGFPFFIWYQFLWVFLCSGLTYTAYRIVLKARPHRPMTGRTDSREVVR
jgi:hypothetical protein